MHNFSVSLPSGALAVEHARGAQILSKSYSVIRRKTFTPYFAVLLESQAQQAEIMI
jgi:hypothetical protein